MYAKFIEYIGLNTETYSNSKASLVHGEIDNNLQLDAIIYFDKLEEVYNHINLIKIKQIRTSKFNGQMIVDKLKTIGDFTSDKIGFHIKHFENYICQIYSKYSKFDEYLDDNEINKIIVQKDLDTYFLAK